MSSTCSLQQFDAVGHSFTGLIQADFFVLFHCIQLFIKEDLRCVDINIILLLHVLPVRRFDFKQNEFLNDFLLYHRLLALLLLFLHVSRTLSTSSLEPVKLKKSVLDGTLHLILSRPS